jgi:hypothetical protein
MEISYYEDSNWLLPANAWKQPFGDKLLTLNGLLTQHLSVPKCLEFATDTLWL